MNKLIIKSCVAILSIALAGSASAFNLGDLKALGEQLKKSVPANNQPKQNQQPSQQREVSETRTGDGRIRTVCEDPRWGFNTKDGTLKTFAVGDPEALVQKYFDIDSTTAEVTLRRLLFSEDINPILGTSWPDAIMDGGIYSGEARVRGVALMKRPSISNLAQVIAAAEQEKKGMTTPNIQLYESKAIFVMVALQLEPILKDKSIIASMLKDSRKKAKFANLTKPLRSPMVYILSARNALIADNNLQAFDNFLTTSRERVTFDNATDVAMLSDLTGGCGICAITHKGAAESGLAGGKYAEQRAQGEKFLADMNQGKAQFNSAAWDRAFSRVDQEAARLDALVEESFIQAKTQSRAASAGAEAARRSQKGREIGMQENPRVSRATRLLRVKTPQISDAKQKAALVEAMEKRYGLLSQTDKLHGPLMAAWMSNDYDVRSLRPKILSVWELTKSQCLATFAQEQATEASGADLPDPSDHEVELDELRGG